LRIRPLRELQTLRYGASSEADLTVKGDDSRMVTRISGNALEMEIVFKAPVAREFGVDVLCDKAGGNGVRIGYQADRKTLQVGTVHAPFELKQGEDLTLRVFVDKNLVEVFANDRQAAVSAVTYVPENRAVRLFSAGGDVTVKEFKAWKMKSAYAGK